MSSATSSATSATRPNVLFLLSDEHSFRCMGHTPASQGGEPVHTPFFDGLAARSTVFSQTYCQMPLCTPSRMCILSGREVRGCGAWTNGSVMDPAQPTMPKSFAAAGYRTCLVGKMHFGGRLQYHGFQDRPYGDLLGHAGHQQDPLVGKTANGMHARTADAGVSQIPQSMLQEQVIATETVAWIREQRDARPEQPWFLCASFSRPHFPLTAPRRHLARYWPEGVTEPKVGATGDAYDHPMSVGMRKGFRSDLVGDEERQHARAAYFACVTYLDEMLGDLLRQLEADGALENTIIVYTSDHGEMAGEHDVWYKNGWYEACTRVPFMVSTPAQRRGEQAARTVETPVGLGDLFPTLCGLTTVTPPAVLDGQDLAAVCAGAAPAPERPVFCDALEPRWGRGMEFRMVRQGRWKYVAFRNAPELLFDLEADPGEQTDLARRVAAGTADAATTAALTELRATVAGSMDFEAAGAEYEAGKALREHWALPKGPANVGQLGNLYHMPTGAIVSAETPLYQPLVATDDPASYFGDFPG